MNRPGTCPTCGAASAALAKATVDGFEQAASVVERAGREVTGNNPDTVRAIAAFATAVAGAIRISADIHAAGTTTHSAGGVSITLELPVPTDGPDPDGVLARTR